MTTTEPHETKKRVRDALDEIRGLGDELRLKAHLAEMDAKEAWEKSIEPRLREVEAKVEHGEEVAERFVEVVFEILRDVRAIRKKMGQ